MKKNKATAANRQFWSFVEQTAERVESWPSWMCGDSHYTSQTRTSPDIEGWATKAPEGELTEHRTKDAAITHAREVAQKNERESAVHNRSDAVSGRNISRDNANPQSDKKTKS